MRVFGLDRNTTIVGVASRFAEYWDLTIFRSVGDSPFLRVIVGSQDREVGTCDTQEPCIIRMSSRQRQMDPIGLNLAHLHL